MAFGQIARWSGRDTPQTDECKRAMEETGAAMQMGEAAFFAFMLYNNIAVRFTTEIPIAAVDGKNLLLNPVRFPQFTVQERVFIVGHEILHLMLRHHTRFRTHETAGGLGGVPFSWPLANFVADYIINRILVNGKIGAFNSSWLLRPDLDDPREGKKAGAVGEKEAFEDVYLRELKDNPPPPPRGGGEGEGEGEGEGNGLGQFDKPMPMKAGKPSATNDGTPSGGKGAFDRVIAPPQHEDDHDPASEQRESDEMRRAVETAKAFAKAIGKLPGGLESFLDEFLAGKVDWKKLLKLTVQARTGTTSRTWSRPCRRQLALRNQYWPAKTDYGCDSVALVIDTSGSVSDHELRVFLGEIAKILQDVRPRTVKLIWCDAAVGRVDEVTNLPSLVNVTAQRGIPGRGGTDMKPGLQWIRDNMKKRPAATIVLTDGFVPWPAPGSFKELRPLWCMTHEQGNFPQGIGDQLVLDLASYQQH